MMLPSRVRGLAPGRGVSENTIVVVPLERFAADHADVEHAEDVVDRLGALALGCARARGPAWRAPSPDLSPASRAYSSACFCRSRSAFSNSAGGTGRPSSAINRLQRRLRPADPDSSRTPSATRPSAGPPCRAFARGASPRTCSRSAARRQSQGACELPEGKRSGSGSGGCCACDNGATMRCTQALRRDPAHIWR